MTDLYSFETFKSKGLSFLSMGCCDGMRHETEMLHNFKFHHMILNIGTQGCLTFLTENSLFKYQNSEPGGTERVDLSTVWEPEKSFEARAIPGNDFQNGYVQRDGE